MRTLSRSFLAVLLFWTAAVAAEVPYLSGRVNDNAEVLSIEMRRSLTEKLRAHEDRTTDQVVVLTIPSLEGESIEEFADKVFKDWRLGQKGKDNGVLLVVATSDRRMRIEVGYGLEGTLTDLLAGRIIRNIIAPRFKAGDYNGGIDAGVTALLGVLDKGEAALPAADAPQEGRKGLGIDAALPDMSLSERILIGSFIFGIIGLFTVIGILTPGVGWFLYLFLIPFWGAFPMIVVGTRVGVILLGIYLVGYPVAKLMLRNKEWYRKAARDLKTKGRASIGGFTFSSGGGGGGWSSGGGGGFSGGGGSSGGGGASGSW